MIFLWHFTILLLLGLVHNKIREEKLQLNYSFDGSRSRVEHFLKATSHQNDALSLSLARVCCYCLLEQVPMVNYVIRANYKFSSHRMHGRLKFFFVANSFQFLFSFSLFHFYQGCVFMTHSRMYALSWKSFKIF